MAPPHTLSNLWATTAGDPLDAPALEGDRVADVVIVGAGFTGLSAALHLAEAGVRVCVLEAETVGHGGSGRNVGLVNAGLWTPPDEVEAALGTAAGQRLNAALAQAPAAVFDLIERHQIRCDAVRGGTLHCAVGAGGMANVQSRHDQQRARGAPVALLDAAETARRTGSPGFSGALWDRRAGTLQPLAYARGLARAAQAAGARIYEHSPAVSMTRATGGWEIATPAGRVTAGRLIRATNAYESGAAARRFVPVHYFQFATAPLPAELRATILPGGEGCWDTATVMSSFRLDAAGRLIVGAVGNLEAFGQATHLRWAGRKLRSLFPQLPPMPCAHAWSGRIAMTADHLPKVTEIGPDAISIYGYSGRGIGPGTVFGHCAARWAIDGDRDAFPVAIRQAAPVRLTGARAFFFEAGATLTHLVRARRRF